MRFRRLWVASVLRPILRKSIVLVLAGAALLLAGIATWPGCGRRHAPKLLVIGLDGATWDLLEPWIQAGDLPNLKALRDASAWGTMNSVIPYLSPPAWTSAVTGVNPGRHGIYDFQRRLPGQPTVVTETAKSRRSPPIWNMLKGTSKRVCVINIPMTDPPDEVDGEMVAGFPHLDQVGFAWPSGLEERCKKMGYILEHMEMKIPSGQEEQIWDEIVATREKHWELAQQLYTENDYDLFWIVFTGTDRVQHLFWKFDDPLHPEYDPEKAAQFGGRMRKFWMDQDRILGRMFALIKPGTWVLILSDHGFGPIHRELRIGNWLHQAGSGFSEDETRDIFPLDRSETARLYVREPGRDPGGTRNPAERIALRDKMSSGLLSLVDPETELHPVATAYPAEQVFVGKYAEKGPSLTLLPSPTYYLSWGDFDTGYKLPCCGNLLTTLSGWHEMDGMFVLAGPGVKPGHADRQSNLLDVVPTCLYLLDQPLPQDLEGRIMDDCLDPGFLRRHKVVQKGRLSEEDRPLTPEEQKALKNLPYVGG